MMALLAMLAVWYLTKLYYTQSFFIKPENIEDGLVRVKCGKCSRVSVISEKNLRTPFYCMICY
jgi:ribosomal protein S27E